VIIEKFMNSLFPSNETRTSEYNKGVKGGVKATSKVANERDSASFVSFSERHGLHQFFTGQRQGLSKRVDGGP